ncbi:MAG: YpsA SLOG family protein [Thermaurantiacus sp.]
MGLILISGGQSGVDRAVLAFAAGAGLPCEGWCPAGGWAEDFPEPPGVRALYPGLRETESGDPAERTRRNVAMAERVVTLWPRGSDRGRSAGTAVGEIHARALGRPLLELALDAPGAIDRLAALLAGGGRLAIGGPRESEAPGAEAASLAALRAAWRAGAGRGR